MCAIFFANWRFYMKLKKAITRLTALFMLLSFSSTTAFAGLNLGNDDGTGFSSGTSNNYWGVHTDSGISLNDTEGLRVTVYDATSNNKVFNTIDISGNPNISAVSNMYYFADGNELVSKTTWLSYIGSTYSSVTESDMIKFNNAILARSTRGDGYKVQYISDLSNIDIVSVNNSSHLEEIKNLLGSKEFLVHLSSLLGGGLTYEDISKGKYKIAFEPVAYFRYNGQNWAMSASECGLLNKYMKNYFTAAWNTTKNLRALLGPLTHSNLPRSAFLENKDLGISVYSPSSSDYYNGNANYNSDTCIIRCMGIGVLSGEEPPDEDIGGEGTTSAEYHTDTDVYTSFNIVNIGETPFIGETTFSIKDSSDELPKTYEDLDESCKEVYKISYNSNGPPSFYYGYTSDELVTGHCDEDSSVKVFVDNPRYVPDENGEYPYGVAPYKLLGSYKNGDVINIGSEYRGTVSYTVKTKGGSTIKSGTVDVNCPENEEAMSWFKWHTPSRAQGVTITIKSNNSDLLLIDDEGEMCEKLVIEADISKVEEITPPDPKVSDTRPSWNKINSMSSVQDKISQYVSAEDNVEELTWYTWSCGTSWSQDWDTDQKRYVLITGEPTYSKEGFPYVGSDYEREEITYTRWGVDNQYYASETARRLSGKFNIGAVYISTSDIHLEKKTYSVSVTADVTLSPSDYCKTATYNNSTGKYTMKSGYGIQISVDSHISGDTEYCTGSQTANVLFPEFNYNRHSTALYNRLLEKVNGSFVFKKNKYSTYNDRVHFTPIWFPDRKNYTIYVEVFDVWCPAGQLSVRLTDQIYIKGNVYDDWHIAPVKP